MSIRDERGKSTTLTGGPEGASTPAADHLSGGTEASAARTETLPPEAGTSAAEAESPAVQTHPSEAESRASTGHGEPSSDNSLFSHHDTAGLLSRWQEVQAAFVDDPKACVKEADELVSTVVDRLTSDISEARSRIEARWSRGEDASTEDLRLALRSYRDFFQRLIAV